MIINNKSKKVLVITNDERFVVPPSSSIDIPIGDNDTLSFCVNEPSEIKKSKDGKRLINYLFKITSTFEITGVTANSNIDLYCSRYYEVFNDEEYVMVTPTLDNCFGTLSSLRIDDKDKLIDEVTCLYENKVKSNKKFDKGFNLVYDLLLCIPAGAVLSAIMYFCLREHLSKGLLIAGGIIVYLLVFALVFTIDTATGSLFDRLFNKKKKPADAQAIVSRYFDENYIRKFVFDKDVLTDKY